MNASSNPTTDRTIVVQLHGGLPATLKGRCILGFELGLGLMGGIMFVGGVIAIVERVFG